MVKVKAAETKGTELEEDQLEKQPTEVTRVLEKYADVFGEPTQMPPSRGVFDHHIPLLEDTSPLNSRPYRYSPLQKDVIETMIKKMLKQGII